MLSHRVLILASATALFGTVLLQGGVAEALPECVDTIGVSSHTDIDGGVGQLREALSEVCDGGSVLIEPGTIVLERGRFTIEESRTVTIIGLGNGDEPEVAIDANGTDRIFTVNAHAALTLDSVRLTGGNVVGHGGAVEALDARLVVIDSTIENNTVAAPYRGGGVYNGDGSVAFINSTVKANSAGYGGGIAASGGTTDIRGSSIEGNTATALSGGGVFAYGSLQITDSTLTGNVATWSGGGIYASNLTLSSATVKDNSARYGGGIYGPRAVVAVSTIKDNTADSYGGGMYVYVELSVSTSVIKDNTVSLGYGGGVYVGSRGLVATFNDSTIEGNAAFQGGGIYTRFSATTITDTAVKDNTATSVGGGIRFVSGSLVVEGSSIIKGNTASTGGGIHWSETAPTIVSPAKVTTNYPNDIYP